MRGPDEASELDRLLEARRRYVALRDALPCDRALDLHLHAELTEAIRLLDAKIARRGRGPSPTLRPGRRGAATRPARR